MKKRVPWKSPLIEQISVPGQTSFSLFNRASSAAFPEDVSKPEIVPQKRFIQTDISSFPPLERDKSPPQYSVQDFAWCKVVMFMVYVFWIQDDTCFFLKNIKTDEYSDWDKSLSIYPGKSHRKSVRTYPGHCI